VSSENDELEYDLSAFEAPEPPDGIADAVIARLDGTAVTPAVPAEPREGKRRGFVVAGVAVACLAAAAGTYALIQGTRRAGPIRGDVVAARARTLSLDGVSAELDPGAHVTWQRRGTLLDVEQREGAAAWRVDDDTTLRIDAGAMVASVEATGASLRVEVSMNATDVRVLGASALTAAAVSMVTVTVYTGHVKLSERGQTVIVQPGETRSVASPQPVRPAPPPENLVAGAPITFDRGRATIADVRIPAGESSTIDVSTVPAMIEIETAGLCSGAVEIYRDGAKLSGAVLMLDAGMHGYAVRCAGSSTNVAVGSIAVVPGAGHIPLTTPTASDANPMPDPSGTLVFLGQPAQGAVWSDSLPVAGQVIPGATVSIGSFNVPVTADGRFAATVPAPASLALAVRVEHAQRGIHYVVVRGKPKTQTVTKAAACDEVSCVLNDYPDGCCDKYKKVPAPPTGDTLDRATISAGIQNVMPKIRACGDQVAFDTKVVMEVVVRADGSVASATSKEPSPQPVSACVAGVLRAATFRSTKKGGAFTYPFNFTSGSSTVATPGGSGLSREDISKTIGGGKSAISTCGGSSAVGGKVIVTVKVQPDGRVGSISLKEAYDKKVGGCVVDNVKKLTFPATNDGGSFSYPFVFDGAACDADADKEAGMMHINRGEHAAALTSFERSLRCKDDPYVRQLAFMEACGSKNLAKARQHYVTLSPVQQSKFEQICIRNGIDPKPPAASTGSGFLQVMSKPPGAKVLVDGKNTGLTTPITGTALPLPAGRHKVTIIVGDDRFTYPADIEDGATATLDKNLE
jgi:ferric-dicitrate binding protein FerR (iron transport regulator)